MSKIIFVNDTAATSGGALAILEQLLNGIQQYSQADYIYYVFCSLKELKKYESTSIKIVNNIKAKKWFDRIKWDFWGLRRWSKQRNIHPDLIISLQNTGVKCFSNIFQIIYFHQSLSVYDEPKWHFFNRERHNWFYQNIYPLLIKISLPKQFLIISQTEAIKAKLQKKFCFSKNRIVVIPPSFESININLVNSINFSDHKFHIFYPAATYIYKNHEIIIKALKYIKDTKPEIFRNLVVHFTFSPEGARGRQLTSLMNKLGVSSAVKLEGYLSYQKVLQYYKSVNLVVFPSFIESHPMPLKEAALFGLPLLVSDTDFSREIISDYKGARFLDYKNYKEWGDAIIETYKKRPRFQPYKVPSGNGWQKFFALEKQLLESNK